MNTLPYERYQTDVIFRNLVDSLECLLQDAHFSPSELKDAVMQAASNHELRIGKRMTHEKNIL
jgi:hypothetical protein